MPRLSIMVFTLLIIHHSSFFIAESFSQEERPPKIPVILDTDIGEDIDDTWALALLLCSPEFDLRMVITEFNDTAAKAKIAAKFLYRLDQGHIPVGVGVKTGDFKGYQYEWAKFFLPNKNPKENPKQYPGEIEKYPGGIHEDGVGAMINLINQATEPITIIVTGPCKNIETMLRRAPAIANKVNIVASMGSINRGYGNVLTPDAEYNVRKDPKAADALFSAPWKIKLAPLDVTNQIILRDEVYQHLLEYEGLTEKPENEMTLEELVQLERLKDAGELTKSYEPTIPYGLPLKRKPKHKVIYNLIQNYRVWLDESGTTVPADARSTTLFDPVAIYLAYTQELLEMKTLKLRVDFTGYTVPSPNGKPVMTALGWRNVEQFKLLLKDRLIQGIPKKPEEEEEDTGIRFERVRIDNSN